MNAEIKTEESTQVQEEFQEIDTTLNKPKLALKGNKSLLDRGKSGGIKKQQSRTNSPSPSLSDINSKSNMTRDQIKYCGAIMRNLKKHRDAAPFLHPVDYVKLNIPDYPIVVKYPMDLTTVDKKLNSGEYANVEDFVSDIRLVFNNCYKFNGPEAMISMLCQNVESAFEKSLRQMPPSSNSMSNTPASMSPANDDHLHRNQKMIERRISEDGRPKREIHPPPSKDYPETITKRNRNPRKNDLQMKFCMQTLKELKKNKYRDINYPFLQPVDVVALNIPDYVEIIKHPMDLATIERKLNEGDYEEPEQFEQDIRLMFNNCYTYNPPNLPVYKMARELEKVFDEKWAQKPEPAPVNSVIDEQDEDDIMEEPEELERGGREELDEEEEESDEDEREQRIAELERHLMDISQQIASIKSQKRKRTGKPKSTTTRRPTGSSHTAKERKPAAAVKEKRKRAPAKRKETQSHQASKALPKQMVDDYPEFSFEQKKELSEQINSLQGDDLTTVVNIIQTSMPNISGQGQEEIVLDIDALDRKTLHKLHEFVTGGDSLVDKKAANSPPTKRARNSYSERDNARKIRQLEKTLQKFNSDNDSSSESDSESSSGSDSDDSGSSSD
ncbi:Bromodomain-containing protein [Mycotypha africana]|uniref:Bromodomain-containing protein n=1 Tax=Mycotypha africana TaxID=64632 RepID=UPI00230130E6|nr:Bromodomain-containing protein [Mycotypha africana]KAI8969219.1 Bromodomain-containing protein [Mycotypha africana]